MQSSILTHLVVWRIMYIQPFSTEMDWPEVLMEVSILYFAHMVFLLCGTEFACLHIISLVILSFCIFPKCRRKITFVNTVFCFFQFIQNFWLTNVLTFGWFFRYVTGTLLAILCKIYKWISSIMQAFRDQWNCTLHHLFILTI